MDDIERIEFEERGDQWFVTLTLTGGGVRPGEPFLASGADSFTKLEQVLYRLRTLGLQPLGNPYDRPDGSRYVFEVKAL